MPTSNAVPSYDPSDLIFNAEKLDEVVNSTAGTYTDRMGVQRRTLTALEAEFPNAAANAAAAAASATQAENEAASAATAVDLAFAEATNAQSARTGAEAARDAALIQAGVYVDEPTGRAAVADGQAFKVQGSGDVAAYEYRRVSSSSSTLIASYPSSSAVAAAKLEIPQLNTGALRSILNDAFPAAYSRGSYLVGAANTPASTICGWRSPFKHNGASFNAVQLNFRGDVAGVFRVEIQSATFQVLAYGQVEVGTSNAVLTVPLNRTIYDIPAGQVCYIAYYDVNRAVSAGYPQGGAYDASDADPAVNREYYFTKTGVWVISTVGGRIHFRLVNANAAPRNFADELTDLKNAAPTYALKTQLTPLATKTEQAAAVLKASSESMTAMQVLAGITAGSATPVFSRGVYTTGTGSAIAGTIFGWKSIFKHNGQLFNMVRLTLKAASSAAVFRVEIWKTDGTVLAAGSFQPKSGSTSTTYTVQLNRLVTELANGADAYIVVHHPERTVAVGNPAGGAYDAADASPVTYPDQYIGAGGVWVNAFPTDSYRIQFDAINTAIGTASGGSGIAAGAVTYNPATSGLSASDVQAAIDALAAASALAPEMVIPPVIYGVQGRECNVYLENLHVGEASEFAHNIDAAGGSQQNERLTWTPTGSLASGAITVEARSKRTGATLRTVTAQQRAAASSAGTGLTKSVLLIGDSLTEAGTITQTLLDIASPDAMKVSLIGTRGTAPNRHEGRGGWTVNDYTTTGRTFYRFTVSGISVAPAINSTEYSHNGSVYMVQEVALSGGAGTITCSVTSGGAPLASGTLTKSNAGAGDATITFSASAAVSGNPFWIGGVLNFGQYLTNNSFSAPDWVFIQLGTNDIFSYTSDATASSIADAAFVKLDNLISSIKSADANTKIGIMIPPPPSFDQDSFGSNYTTGQTRARFKRNILIWARQLIAKYTGQESNRIYIVPSNTALDTVNNMSRAAAAPINSRNSSVTVARQSNGVHPAASGYQQIGDAVWAFLKFYA